MDKTERQSAKFEQELKKETVRPEVHLRALGYIPKGHGGIWYNGTNEIKVEIRWNTGGKWKTTISGPEI